MLKIIEYFIRNKRLNYVLLFFVLFMGIEAYVKIPKEMFPVVTLDKIMISGGYPGTSADNLDKMAVRDIEDGLGAISGVDKIETVIKPGSFSIVISLQNGADKIDALNKAKDAIAKSRQYLPPDMVEPTAQILLHHRPLVRLSLSSDTLSKGELIEAAKAVKNRLARFPNISEVRIFGDADEEVSVRLDTDAIAALGLDRRAVVEAIGGLSYIYPVGNIEQKGDFVYVSTVHGKSTAAEYENTILRVGSKYVRLGDIARVRFTFPQEGTLSSFNGRPNITLKLSKGDEGNAIAMSRELRHFVETTLAPQYPQIHFDFYHDSSIPVKKRLDVVISNLMFGLILVFLSMALLINLRIAAVVTLGIPFSFAIGLVLIYVMGYSINIISLLGALIVIGIVVDDAIVVSENIQRHLNEGMDRHAAVMAGVREMLLPVTLATVTTIAAFLPLFMMTGEIGKFIILIPVAVVLILIGSLIESFLFLPLHALEVLRPQKNLVDWSRLQNGYESVLHFLIRYKRSVLAAFVVGIPLLTVATVKSMHFQFFPNFDSTYLYVTGKVDIDTPIEETDAITQRIVRRLLANKDDYGLKSVSAITGTRINAAGENESGNNVFYITMKLHDMAPQSFIDRWVNPVLNFSFDFNDPDRIRTRHTFELARQVRHDLEPVVTRYKLEDLAVVEQKAGIIRSDIQLDLGGRNDTAVLDGVKMLEKALRGIDGVTEVTDNLQYGKNELKLRINAYGERLGIDEKSLAQTLSAYFLDARRAMTFGENGVMEIKTRALDKDDIATLKNFQYPLGGGKFVKLTDVADMIVRRDFEKIEKRDGVAVRSVFASVNKRVMTAEEVLGKLAPVIDKVRERGIKVNLLGEKEKNKQLASDMKRAVIVALFLILITLLFIFDRIKYALIVMSVIPLSILGALLGHKLLGINLSMPSVIGILGLAGVVINDGIIMLDFLHGTHDAHTFYERAKMRLRPILITSITTFLGLFTLIFYATGQAVILQPIAVSIGFGLLWGTVLNLLYVPALYAVVNHIDPQRSPS